MSRPVFSCSRHLSLRTDRNLLYECCITRGGGSLSNRSTSCGVQASNTSASLLFSKERVVPWHARGGHGSF